MENTLVGEKTIAFSIAQEILTTSVNIPTIPTNGTKILAIVKQPNRYPSSCQACGIRSRAFHPDSAIGQFAFLC